MNSKIKLAVIAILSCCSIVTANWSDDWETIQLSSLSEQQAYKFMTGAPNNVIIEVPEGTVLPLEFCLSGEILEFHQNDETCGHIQVKKTFYMRHEECGFMFSADLISWYPLELFVTGEINTSVQLDAEEPLIKVGGVIDLRK